MSEDDQTTPVKKSEESDTLDIVLGIVAGIAPWPFLPPILMASAIADYPWSDHQRNVFCWFVFLIPALFYLAVRRRWRPFARTALIAHALGAAWFVYYWF